MAAGDIVPVPGARFEEALESASPDLLREMIKGFAQRMDADVEDPEAAPGLVLPQVPLISERSARSIILTSNRAPQDLYLLFPQPASSPNHCSTGSSTTATRSS